MTCDHRHSIMIPHNSDPRAAEALFSTFCKDCLEQTDTQITNLIDNLLYLRLAINGFLTQKERSS